MGLHGTLLGSHAGLQYWEALHVYSIGRPHGIQYREALWVYSTDWEVSCGSTVLGGLVSHTAVGFAGGFMAVGDLRWALRADSIWRPYGATASKHHLVFRGLVESAQNQPLH